MGREAYRSLYGDLTKLKDDSVLKDPAGGTGDDDELFQLLLAASVQVDRLCNRHFYSLTGTRVFDGPGGERLVMPDLISVTSIKADEDDDQSYEVTWGTRDYATEPYNQDPTAHWGGPYTSVLASKTGSKQEFLAGQRRYQIAGKWGFSEVKERSGSLVDDTAGFASGDGTFGVDEAGDFSVGQTIMVDSEQMLVTDIDRANDRLSVTRGLNGTRAMGHADHATVWVIRWPAPVERATLIQAARIWTRAPDFQPFYVDADLDTDVRLLLDSYRRPAPLI